MTLLSELKGRLALGQWAGAATAIADNSAGAASGRLERIDGLAKHGQIGYWRHTARKGE